MHKEIEYPKSNECDITCRFLNESGNGIYQLNTLESEELVKSLEKNINTFIIPVINDGVSKFFELFPQYSCMATRSLKEYLGMMNVSQIRKPDSFATH